MFVECLAIIGKECGNVWTVDVEEEEDTMGSKSKREQSGLQT